ncbi:Protein pim1 [Verticillium dahliae VDG1]|nr:Protein pim1 [Verticillium dahliae VDG1]
MGKAVHSKAWLLQLTGLDRRPGASSGWRHMLLLRVPIPIGMPSHAAFRIFKHKATFCTCLSFRKRRLATGTMPDLTNPDYQTTLSHNEN